MASFSSSGDYYDISDLEAEAEAGRGGGFSDNLSTKAGEPPQHFLHSCFLCKKLLSLNTDIFMYRGNTPFCSEECRNEQIIMDEEAKEKGWKHKHSSDSDSEKQKQKQKQKQARKQKESSQRIPVWAW